MRFHDMQMHTDCTDLDHVCAAKIRMNGIIKSNHANCQKMTTSNEAKRKNKDEHISVMDVFHFPSTSPRLLLVFGITSNIYRIHLAWPFNFPCVYPHRQTAMMFCRQVGTCDPRGSVFSPRCPTCSWHCGWASQIISFTFVCFWCLDLFFHPPCLHIITCCHHSIALVCRLAAIITTGCPHNTFIACFY